MSMTVDTYPVNGDFYYSPAVAEGDVAAQEPPPPPPPEEYWTAPPPPAPTDPYLGSVVDTVV